MSRKQGVIRMTGLLLTQMLKDTYTEFEDKDFNVRGIKYDPFIDTVEILLEGDGFPEIVEGAYADIFGYSQF